MPGSQNYRWPGQGEPGIEGSQWWARGRCYTRTGSGVGLKIRSITLGSPVEPDLRASVQTAGRFLSLAAARFSDAGYEVQTRRLCLPPLVRAISPNQPLGTFVTDLEAAAREAGVEYVALGPIRWSDDAVGAAFLARGLAEALARAEVVFGSIETADSTEVHYEAVESAAATIRRLADITDNGFGNLRFAALANCPAGIPFFPAAYHESAEPAFGLALQAADLAVRAFDGAGSLEQAERVLTLLVTDELDALERLGVAIEAETGIRYVGADPTLAPFPADDESIVAALERLGVNKFGAAGTLTAAALVTRALRAVKSRRCGFAGLMLPVLEDSVLAKRSAEGLFGWQELLLYSAVCGTGLDTVPLPGEISADELASIVLDVSTLAVALAKPLTCRLFPVLGKLAGEPTTFDFPFFADGRVFRTSGLGSPRLLERGRVGQHP